jgi:hypothetical protein
MALPAVEGRRIDIAEVERGFLERATAFMRVLRNLGCFVIADFGRQRGYEHQ